MCGRYAATRDPATLAAEFDAVDGTDALGGTAPGPDYNVAPTKPVLAVVERHPREPGGEPDPTRVERSIRVMRWGLVPAWASDPGVGSQMINARAETAAVKPAYRTSLARRRCLLPTDGWYEWKKEGGRRQPYYVTPPDGSSLVLAGIWTTWRSPDLADDAPPLITCAVLTTDAVGQLADVHHRMPLMLPRDLWSAWLDPNRTEVDELLHPTDDAFVAGLELRPVSTAVNNVRNNGPHLLERVDPDAEPAPVPDQARRRRLRVVPDPPELTLFDQP
ncbi:putative SOS response-associated peptidase YedK [Streptoalloteichus tenebrarius]|uniref:Abasic site processing protein n=1 Tax=Streptoalloteichus tenebrarius (strain ATCC 17920 / DSM 40477 / JCM 4838 / CBS 697.72 / NBRC 16177 / NCIMB 11028 / NRRL B-12390 / A12253. 1 / ISP 5477) TaxID=1933 RepID=A0ABT1HT50_STRSD|nr:SOS response-associated peptidase [Streptoalloteichus tenebrarius]MCP2258701.1 putative SOS response-associated peptidase YedK [Streptoalloteichus tenebrarius]BFF02847.1 SOS response-associated peptidase [Streptoalloteichus tenebrarius]